MNIQLRRTLAADLDFVLNAEMADENCAFVSAWTREQHEQSLSNPDVLQLILERCLDQQPVGYIIMAGLEQAHQSIEFRRMVVTEKGNGYGREALRSVKKMAFDDLQAHRLWLDVKDFNLRAIKLYESEGFVAEGTLRECIKRGERFESLMVFSMLQNEYQKN